MIVAVAFFGGCTLGSAAQRGGDEAEPVGASRPATAATVTERETVTAVETVTEQVTETIVAEAPPVNAAEAAALPTTPVNATEPVPSPTPTCPVTTYTPVEFIADTVPYTVTSVAVGCEGGNFSLAASVRNDGEEVDAFYFDAILLSGGVPVAEATRSGLFRLR